MSSLRRWFLLPFPAVLGLLAASAPASSQPAQPVLADPASYSPYTCVQSQTLSYEDRVYGTIRGWVYRPLSGLCHPALGPPSQRPVLLLLNGAGYGANHYTYLAQHLARNGFVVVAPVTDEPFPTIACAGGGPICIEDRARKGVSFLRSLRSHWAWTGQVQWDNVSTLGHSRGGEAAVEAAALIRWEEPALGNPGVRSVIALAPTDLGDDGLTGRRRLLGRESPAFLVVYGSRDEQVKGLVAGQAAMLLTLPAATGFALYDRVGREGSLSGLPISLDDQVDKAMHFVYQANHHQFSDACGSSAACAPSVLACAAQQQTAKGLVNAFLLWKVWGSTGYKAFFDGSIVPGWGADSWPQYSQGDWGSRRVIDDFQDGEIPTNALGGALSIHGGLVAEVVDNASGDERMLHGGADGQRLRVSHNVTGPSNILQWTLPASAQNASSYSHLSLRIGQGFGSLGPATVRVRMQRGGAWSNLVSSPSYGEIPAPDAIGDAFCLVGFAPDRTIAHMRTIRIPLSAFGGNLGQVQKVQVRFDHASTQGKWIYLDNLEFTGGSGGIELP